MKNCIKILTISNFSHLKMVLMHKLCYNLFHFNLLNFISKFVDYFTYTEYLSLNFTTLIITTLPEQFREFCLLF